MRRSTTCLTRPAGARNGLDHANQLYQEIKSPRAIQNDSLTPDLDCQTHTTGRHIGSFWRVWRYSLGRWSNRDRSVRARPIAATPPAGP